VRPSPIQRVVTLGVLTAGVVLGAEGRVDAGFVTPVELARSGTGFSSFGLTGATEGGADTQGSSRSLETPDEESPAPRRGEQGPHTPDGRDALSGNLLPSALRPSGGCQGGPSPVPASGGSAVCGLLGAPCLPPLAQNGLLFLADVFCRPPPFASRLFRPPRVV
jgi:hypothetical protein